MRVLFHALAAVGVLTVAAPASALTIQPLSTTTAAAPARAMFSDPAAKMAGGAAGYRWAIAGDDSGASGLPVYFEPTDAGSQADEDRYASDPVGFMARVDGSGPVTPAAARSAAAVHAGVPAVAPKAPLNGR
jgi:hypothetical protein